MVVGAASKFFTANWPETAKFLNDEERRMLVARLARDHGEARMDHLDKRAARRVFSDWKIYCGILMYLGIVNTGYSGSVRFQSVACIHGMLSFSLSTSRLPFSLAEPGWTCKLTAVCQTL